MAAPTLNNRELGDLIDLTHSSVSRIRSGVRLPSPDAMIRIEKALGWPVAEQMKKRSGGKYASAFERRVREYAKQAASASVPG